MIYLQFGSGLLFLEPPCSIVRCFRILDARR